MGVGLGVGVDDGFDVASSRRPPLSSPSPSSSVPGVGVSVGASSTVKSPKASDAKGSPSLHLILSVTASTGITNVVTSPFSIVVSAIVSSPSSKILILTSSQASESPRYFHLIWQASSTMQVLSAPPTLLISRIAFVTVTSSKRADT